MSSQNTSHYKHYIPFFICRKWQCTVDKESYLDWLRASNTRPDPSIVAEATVGKDCKVQNSELTCSRQSMTLAGNSPPDVLPKSDASLTIQSQDGTTGSSSFEADFTDNASAANSGVSANPCYWSDSNGSRNPDSTNRLQNYSSDRKSEHTVTTSKDGSLSREGSCAERNYPASFNELVELLQKGEPIPGVIELNIQPTNAYPTASARSCAKKPWEA